MIFCFSVCGFNNDIVLLGRPYGGCAILCRKSLNASFQPIECESKRLVALKMKSEGIMNILINIYMPCERNDSTEDFISQLAYLCDILDRFPNCNIIIGGDLNVDFNRSTTHTALFRNFIDDRDLICDTMLAGENNVDFSYHFDNTRFSTIDHFIVSSRLALLPDTCLSVEHSVDNTSDHDPVTLQLRLNVSHLFAPRTNSGRQHAWHKCSDKNIEDYRSNLNYLLGNTDIPVSSLVCTNLFCTDPIHINALNEYCSNILDCCICAADTCIPLTGVGANRRVPGWSKHVQPYKDKAMFWHNIWMDMGRPHDGIVAEIRRSSRAKYHQAIRTAMREESTLVRQKIAECMLNNRDRDFWKEIKRIRGSYNNVPTTIDDCSDRDSIVNLFASSYKHLYSSVVSSDDEMNVIRDNSEMIYVQTTILIAPLLCQ